MQHHPGSWYIPWGVPGMGIQKMLAVPFNPATAGYHQPQIAAAAVQPPPQVQTASQQQASQQAASYHHQYQQHQHHPAAALHNPAAAVAAAAAMQQHQSMHSAAAAAMFTPMNLRNFMAHHQAHMNLGQQPIATAQQPQHTSSSIPGSPQTQAQQLTALGLNGAIGAMVPMRQQQPTQQQSGMPPQQQQQQQQMKTPTNMSTNTLLMPMRKVSVDD